MRQIIGKIDFPRLIQEKNTFFENKTFSCHGNVFVGVTSKSRNLAKIALLVSMETWSHENSDKI